MIIPVEKEQLYKSQLSTLLLFNSNLTAVGAERELKSMGTDLDNHYIGRLLKDIHQERSTRYLEQGKEEAMAQLEELGAWIIEKAKAIMDEEAIVYEGKNKSIKAKIISQSNRIKALDLILKTADKMIGLKMDLGIFERQLGRVKGDHSVLHLMAAIKEYDKQPIHKNTTEIHTD